MTCFGTSSTKCARGLCDIGRTKAGRGNTLKAVKTQERIGSVQRPTPADRSTDFQDELQTPEGAPGFGRVLA